MRKWRSAAGAKVEQGRVAREWSSDRYQRSEYLSKRVLGLVIGASTCHASVASPCEGHGPEIKSMPWAGPGPIHKTRPSALGESSLL